VSVVLAECPRVNDRSKIDEVKRFLDVALRISNAHTVDFYARDVWDEFVAVRPEEVTARVYPGHAHVVAPDAVCGDGALLSGTSVAPWRIGI
uniref:Uncharacterized protein n=1 Tax=Denticeps clupeoides TaxID=299321 RepID=A0AAY4EGY6_9TELE